MISVWPYITSVIKNRIEALIDVGLPIAGIATSLVVSAILIGLSGVNPLTAYSALIEGAIGSFDQIASGLNRSTPLILAGLGMVVAFRAGAFNIGGEGQIALGGLGTTIVAFHFVDLWPPILIFAALLGGAIAGGLWAGVAAVITLWRGAHEVVVTLLLNFIAFLFIGLLLAGPLGQPGMGFPQSPLLPPTALFPIILSGTDLHAGIILALFSVVVVHLIIWRMPVGFEMRTAGQSSSVARYAGINVPKTFFIAMFFSGMLGGIAGATEVMGVHYRLIEGFSEGFGFDAIAVALIGGLNPVGVVPAALFVGFLRSGAGFMQRSAGVPSAIIFVIQGLAILFVIASLAMRPKSKTAGA
jgi:simple sugar transport system permease protein